MDVADETLAPEETQVIRLRYWAAARAAAGTDVDEVPADAPLSVADLRDRAVAAHPDGGLDRVIAACSVLVDDRPLGTRDATTVRVAPGSTVEFLPPFAGG